MKWPLPHSSYLTLWYCNKDLLRSYELIDKAAGSEKNAPKQRGKRKAASRGKKGVSINSHQSRLQPVMPAPKPKRSKADYTSFPDRFVGKRVAKDFGEMGIYFGTIKEASVEEDQVLWSIAYDDGDNEDYDTDDLQRAQDLYAQVKNQDEQKPLSGKKDDNVAGDVAAKGLADSISSESDIAAKAGDVQTSTSPAPGPEENSGQDSAKQNVDSV